MKIIEFAKKNNIKESKVKKMVPYIPLAKQCPYCQKWEIPDNATPIYVADKRRYGNVKKYCYLMDAIAHGMQIHDAISGVTLAESKTIIPELKEKGLIVLKQGCKISSLDYNDYKISAVYAEEWLNKNLQNKTQIIIEVLKTIQELAKLGTSIAAVAMSK